MRAKIAWLVLVLLTGCVWAQENQQTTTPPAAGGTAAAPATPHPATISAEDKAKKNPVKFNEVSVDRGKKIFTTQCALCHGDKGDGKGPVAEDMKLNLPDFTKPDTLKNRTDGEIFAIIGAGQDPMPPQAGRMTDERRWNLVNYLRAVGGAVPAKATGKEPEENVILIQK